MSPLWPPQWLKVSQLSKSTHKCTHMQTGETPLSLSRSLSFTVGHDGDLKGFGSCCQGLVNNTAEFIQSHFKTNSPSFCLSPCCQPLSWMLPHGQCRLSESDEFFFDRACRPYTFFIYFFIYNCSRLMTDPVEFFMMCVCFYSFLTPLMSLSLGWRLELGMLAPWLARLRVWEAANGPLAFRLKARADLILWGNNK